MSGGRMSRAHGEAAVTAAPVGPVDSCVSQTCCGRSPGSIERLAGWHHAATMARLLSWVSLGWMAAEGALGLIAGAGAGSISLTGWALGSTIEGLASVVVIWRFTGSRTLS